MSDRFERPWDHDPMAECAPFTHFLGGMVLALLASLPVLHLIAG